MPRLRSLGQQGVGDPMSGQWCWICGSGEFTSCCGKLVCHTCLLRRDKVERLRERVEKLKKSNEFVGSIDAIVLASQGKHIITNKMIDEAWLRISDWILI